MKTIHKIILFAMLLAAKPVWGQLGFALVWDMRLNMVAGQQLLSLQRLNAEVLQTNQLLSTLVRHEGEPMAAVGRMADYSSFITNVGKMGAPKYAVDNLIEKANANSQMAKPSNKFDRDKDRQVQGYGKVQERDGELYRDVSMLEAASNGARELLEVNRQHQHTFLGYLSTANRHLQSSSTTSEIMAAQAEVLRLHALMTGADALSRNVASDLEIAGLQRELAREGSRRRSAEGQSLKGRQWQEEAKHASKRYYDELEKQLAVGRRHDGNGSKRGF